MKRAHALLVIILAVAGGFSLLWLTETHSPDECSAQKNSAPAAIAEDVNDQAALLDAALIAQGRCQPQPQE